MKISKKQLIQMDVFLQNNARKIDLAKWNYLFHKGSKESITEALKVYQNKDGGFGNGLEADICMTGSSSIVSTEAILIAFEYGLDCKETWFTNLLNYFEKTVDKESKLKSFWEKVPSMVDYYPHAPWWNYQLEEKFSPNPCGVVAAAFIIYGNESQKALGEKIKEACITFLKSEDICSEHDCYCLQKMVETLKANGDIHITSEIQNHMERRVLENLCVDTEKWQSYVAQPLDLAVSPTSLAYSVLEPYIPQNLDYWIETLNENGYWEPNFSWGEESEKANQVTTYWKGYITVKRMKILKKFERLEK